MFLSYRYILWDCSIYIFSIPMFPTIKIQEKLFTRYHYGLIKAHLDDEDDDDEDGTPAENEEDRESVEDGDNDDEDDDDDFEEEVL